MTPAVLGPRPKPGTVVAIPVGVAGKTAAMVFIEQTPGFGDTYGLARGTWTEEQIQESGWDPPVYESPIFTLNRSLRDAKWRAISYRPDLLKRFTTPEWLYHPDQASIGISHGTYGLAESPTGAIRQLSKEEAQRRFLPVGGVHHQALLADDLVALMQEHSLTGKERATVAAEPRPGPVPPVAPQRKPRPKSLAALKRQQFFSSWKGFVPAGAIRKAEGAVHEAIGSLEGKSPAQAARRLATLVRTFNMLDFDKGTIERETIMDAVELLASACGVDEEVFEELIDGERDF